MNKCKGCKHGNSPENCDVFDCTCENNRYEPITNADILRSMTDEELAQWFSELIKDTKQQEYLDEFDDWFIWLQSPDSISE